MRKNKGMVKSISGKEDEYPLPPYRAAFVGLNPMCRRHLARKQKRVRTRAEHAWNTHRSCQRTSAVQCDHYAFVLSVHNANTHQYMLKLPALYAGSLPPVNQ